MGPVKISLPDDLARFVETKVSSGRFSSSSDVIGEALRLMERQEQFLQDAWREGIESGDFQPLDLAGLKGEARRRLAAQR